MGAVYLAEQIPLGRLVALKLLGPELSSDMGFRERFLRESQLMASIDHPNVVPVYDGGEEDGTLFIAMRYIRGTDLATVLRQQGAQPPERVISIVRQIASALDASHRLGLIHRDVKPGNVLLEAVPGRPEDRCYLCDFGLTKRISSKRSLTDAESVVGTVDYIAPEQIAGEHVDLRVDVYSLGCVLYECLTGHPPFERDSDVAVLWAHMHDPPPEPSRYRPDLPPTLDQVLASAMAKRREDRYPTCGALATAAAAAAGIRTRESFTPRPSFDGGRQQPPSRRKRRTVLLVAVPLVVSLAAAAVIAALTLGGAGTTCTTDGRSELCTVGPDGNETVRLTNIGAIDQAGVWSPDSGRIAFVSDRDGDQDVYVMNADGTGVRLLTTNQVHDAAPVWSSDDRIAYITEMADQRVLVAVDPDGAHAVQLHATSDQLGAPAWSPDGNTIAFVSDADGDREIYVLDVERQGDPVQLTRNKIDDAGPAWSPDGAVIMFVRTTGHDGELAVMDSDGSEPTVLTDNNVDEGWPSWSPDGNRLVFASQLDGDYELYLMNPDASDWHQVTHNDLDDTGPVWSPDGRRILYETTVREI